MPERTIILFDLMDTLVREPFMELVPAHFGMTLEQLLAVKDPRSWIDFEHGHIDEATYAERFFADRRKVELAPLKEHMKASYAWLEGAEPLLAELKEKGFEMHALSNYSCWYMLIDEKLGLSRYLSLTFVSCLTGVRKPDPTAYLNAARTLGVEPNACVFIDDRRKNVDAAISVGMRGVLKGGPIDALRGELCRIGLL